MKRSIFCYNTASASARQIQDEYNRRRKPILRIDENSTRRHRIRNWGYDNADLAEPNFVINWGSNGQMSYPVANLLISNNRNGRTYSDKKEFFKVCMRDSSLLVPRVMTYADAISLVSDPSRNPRDDRPILVERHNLTGHSGDGIRLVYHNGTVSANAKLYVEYIPKIAEYRCHFFRGIGPGGNHKLIWQEKKMRRDAGEVPNQYQIRNWQNGWVFCRENITIPPVVLSQAINFANSPQNSLDFGALDIIYNQRNSRAYILEVNTAPGIEGQTLVDYVDAFQEYERTHDWSSRNHASYTRIADASLPNL